MNENISPCDGSKYMKYKYNNSKWVADVFHSQPL